MNQSNYLNVNGWESYEGAEHHNICRKRIIEEIKGAEHRDIKISLIF